MSQPLRSALSHLRPASLRAPPRPTPPSPSSIPSRKLSAASFAVDEEQSSSAFDLNIIDIFDAPARLGESSRLLALNAAASSSRQARPLSTSAASQRPAVKPLPTPVLFDGPARPRGMSFVSFRLFRPRPVSTSSVGRSPPPMPPPTLFDGPSQLRPYIHGDPRSRSISASFAMSLTPLILAAAAAATLFGIDVAAHTPAPESSSSDS
ncbi:hypothetical protein C8Q76DRAFT_799873 [Earliella scabrosa]|nr:hypothetical protein C8Q76DRAFT_799873 [Earliella scabrosa]